MNPLTHLFVIAQSQQPFDGAGQQFVQAFRDAAAAFNNGKSGMPGASGPSGIQQWQNLEGGVYLLLPLLLVFLLIPKGARNTATSAAKKAAGGVSPLLIVGVVSVAAVGFVVLRGGI